MPSPPTLSAPATSGPTPAQRGVSVPHPAETPRQLTFSSCGGTVLFAGSPLDITTAREGRKLLRQAAADATKRFNFALGNALWEAHRELSDAYDQALRWRLAGRV